MSVEPTDDTTEQSAGVAPQDDRFVELDAGDGVIIYDRQNHRAWLQSDEAAVVTERR